MDDMFHVAVEAAPAAMILVGADGRIELVNAECVRMFGHPRERLVGSSIDVLVPAHQRGGHRALRAGFHADPSKRLMGVGRDLKALRADGSEFPVEIGLTPVADGEDLGVIAFVIDITERIEAETQIRRHAAKLEQANDHLARFAYVASHDIQEPLRKIAAFADVLTSALAEGDTDEVTSAAEVMSSSARHARRLVSDVLTLAQSFRESVSVEPVSLKALVDEVVSDLSQMIRDEDADFGAEVEDLEIPCDRGQAVRLITNLVSNGVKYHVPGRRPVVRITSSRDADGVAKLTVRDEGIGFAPRHAEAIFEPFRRLHARDAYAGTGIGLAICRAIADRYGWTLRASSAEMAGATFEVRFGRGPARRDGST